MTRFIIALLLVSLCFASPAKASCGPDSTPSPALTHGLTCETFFDDFQSLSTIDTTNSGAAGFKWYIDTTWVNNAQSSWGTFCASNIPTCTYDSSNYSLITSFVCGTGSNNVTPGLCINNANNVNAGKLSTCAPSATQQADGFFYTGQSFVPPLYVDITVEYSDPGRGVSAQWPEFFALPLEMLSPFDGSRPPPPYATTGPLLEIDPLDVNASGNGVFQNAWSGGVVTQFNNYSSGYPSLINTPTHFQVLIVPEAYNGGTGLITAYKAGVSQLSFNYGHNSRASNQPGEPIGAYSQDWNHECFMMNAGFTAPMHITHVGIWQLPPATGGGF